MLPKDKVIEDLQYLINTLENVHPNLYYNSDQKAIRTTLDNIRTDLSDRLSTLDFYRTVCPVISLLNDGHTSCFPVQEYTSYVSGDHLFLPLDIKIVGDQIVVKEVLTQDTDIKKDSIITSINGVNTTELIQTMKNYVSGEDDLFKTEMIGLYFRHFMWMLYDFNENYHLTYLDGDIEHTKTLSGVSYDKVIAALDHLEDNTSPVALSYHEDIACLTLDTFADYDQYSELVHKHMDEIIDKDIKKLVIDLRNNSGGDSRIGDALLSRLLCKPFRQYSNIHIKISDEIKTYYKENEFIRNYYLDFDPSILDKVEASEPGDILSTEGQYVAPREYSTFSGQVCLLTSTKTYSSASSFVTTFHDYQLGKIIGESPGGFSNSYGDLYVFQLPHSQLQVTVSHKYHIRPNGDANLSKIIPDKYVDHIRHLPLEEILPLL